MIPAVLTAPPAPVRTGAPTLAGTVKAIGVLLLVAALGGALAWYLVLSPFSFRRWSSFDLPPQLVISEPGTFVVYEERPGASASNDVPDLRVSVLSIGGKKLDGRSMVRADGTSQETYRTPFHEGRALASFTIDKPGTYNVFAFATTSSTPVTVASAPKLAFAPEGRPGWLGSMLGLVPLVLVPTVLSVVLFVLARRLRPRPPTVSVPSIGPR